MFKNNVIVLKQIIFSVSSEKRIMNIWIHKRLLISILNSLIKSCPFSQSPSKGAVEEGEYQNIAVNTSDKNSDITDIMLNNINNFKAKCYAYFL
jgi:hypothetical protein